MLDILNQKFIQRQQELLAIGKDLKELDKINIPLSHDPISEGLSTLNQKIADIQKSKDFTCSLALKILAIKSKIENMNISMEKYLLIKKNEIMDKDPEFYNKLKSQALRDIAMEKPLVAEMELAGKITQLVTVVKGNYAAVQLQLSNLESNNNNLKKQLEVIETMISIGEIQTKYNK